MTAPFPSVDSLGKPSSPSASKSKVLSEEANDAVDNVARDSLEDRERLLADNPLEEASRTQ